MKEDNQKFFRDFAKFKDKIAGFKELVKNRYFMSKEEFSEDIKEAGFSEIKFFDLKIKYVLSTKKWCEVDFEGNKKKLKELNEYIRNLDSKHSGIEIEDLGADIQIVIPALISVAKK